MNWKTASAFTWVSVSSSGFISKPAYIFICTLVSTHRYIWKRASTLIADDGFQIYRKVKTSVGFQCERQFSNLGICESRLRTTMQTQVHDLIPMETGEQYFLDAGFRFHRILGNGFQYLLYFGFRNCCKFETSV